MFLAVYVIVDSSIYINWLKKRENVVHRLMPVLKRDELLTCGIIKTEVLRGIVHEGQRGRMEELFSMATDVHLDTPFWDNAWKLAWKLDRRGIVLPISDICIAQIALSMNAYIVTTDAHYGRILGVKCGATMPL
jgi:predicted nucleic acid-binding protein